MNEILTLMGRNIKIYLRDKVAVFFSFLSVIILLLIYILFLGNQFSSPTLETILTPAEIDFFKYSVMMPGVLVLNTLTISMGNLGTLIEDMDKRYLDGFLVTPVKRSKIVVSYYLSSLMITLVFTVLMWILAVVLIGLTTGIFYQFDVIFMSMGLIIIFSFISSSLMVLITTFIKSMNAFGAFSGVFGSLIGFTTGIYMPLSVLPEFMVNIASVVPFTHFVILLKSIIMKQSIDMIAGGGVPEDYIEGIKKGFGGSEIGIVGLDVPMIWILIFSSILAAVFLVLATLRMSRRMHQ